MMKTQFITGKYLILFVAAIAAFTSCLEKTDHPTIYIGDFAIYVIQQTDGETTQYLPHIGFFYHGTEELSRAEIHKDGELMNADTYTSLQLCQIPPADYAEENLTALNGVYTLNPIGKNGGEWKREYELDFTGVQPLGEVTVTEFGYKNHQLYATFNSVDNAVKYGFYILPFIDGKLIYYSAPFSDIRLITVEPDALMGEINVTVDFNPYTYLAVNGIEEFRIVPVAVSFSKDMYKRPLVRKAADGAVYGDLRGENHDKEAPFVSPQR